MSNDVKRRVTDSVNLQTKKDKSKEAIREICQKIKVAEEQQVKLNISELQKTKADAYEYYADYVLEHHRSFLSPTLFCASFSAFASYFFIHQYAFKNFSIIEKYISIHSYVAQFAVFSSAVFFAIVLACIAMKVMFYDSVTNLYEYVRKMCGACCDNKKYTNAIYQLLKNRFDCTFALNYKKMLYVAISLTAIYVLLVFALHNINKISVASFVLLFSVAFFDFTTCKKVEENESEEEDDE